MKQAVFVLVFLISVLPSMAELREYKVSGALTDNESATSPYLAFGNQYSLTFVYDTAAIPTYSFGGMRATYSLVSATLELKSGANTLTVFSDNALNKVIIRQESSYHGYDFYAYLPAYIDFSQGMVTSQIVGSLGFSPLTLPLNQLTNYDSSRSGTTLSGTLPSSVMIVSQGSTPVHTDAAAVPEPATYGFICGALCLIACLFKRRARSHH